MIPPLIMMPAWNCCATRPAATTTSAHRTGRQRGDGSRPSGNSSTRTNSKTTVTATAAADRTPATLAAGTVPGAVARPYRAYCSVSMATVRDKPVRPSSQPIALPGTRRAIRPPAPA